ncbi:MAG: protein-export chaperone SecB [Pseudomonadota bacterium]
MSEDNSAPGGEEQRVQVQISLERIYLKDASFESPGSPNIFVESFKPEMQVDINTRVNSLGDNRHEVVLRTTVTAKRDGDKVAYLVEIQQAGIFVVQGVNETALRQVLGVHCPNMLFPYVRESLDALIVKGNFAALQLAPVNFEMLYAQAVQQQQATAAQEDIDVTH